MLKRTLGASFAVAAMVLAFAQTPLLAGATQVDIPTPAFVMVNSCNGESISFGAGSLHGVMQVNVQNDIAHLQVHANGNVKGVGSTGASYNFQQNQHIDSNVKIINNTGNATFQLTARLEGQGPSNNVQITLFFHITINANGVVTSMKVDPGTLTCSNG